MTSSAPIESFAALAEMPGLQHGFFGRVPGLDVTLDKAAALQLLDDSHRSARARLGLDQYPFVTVEQTHGRAIAIIDHRPTGDQRLDHCDALITNQRGVCLGIYVADCCAIYLFDPAQRAIGLVHSGRKGTELNIAAHAIEQLQERFGTNPADLIVQLSPCIRPPHYEIDFAAEIQNQCRQAGVRHVHDCGISTATDLARYYSYRMEQGRTGRMLAVLALT